MVSPVPTDVDRRSGLSADEIVDVARALIVEHGVGWFSMRKLGAALGVSPMTVYLRFDTKDALLDAVAGRLVGEIALPTPDGQWDEQAVAVARAVRDHLLANPNLLPLLASSGRLAGAMLRLADRGLSVMTAAGFAQADAVRAFRALFWHAVGSALVHAQISANPVDAVRTALGDLDDDAVPTFVGLLPHFDVVDADALFDYTTRLLVTGLAGDPTRKKDSP